MNTLRDPSAQPTAEFDKIRRAQDKVDALEAAFHAVRALESIKDTDRINWIEKNPDRLKHVLYKGNHVWYVGPEDDFKTAREAIDNQIKHERDSS